MSVDVRVDCPTCLVEGARIETRGDASDARIESTRCRLCDRGVPTTDAELRAALEAWAGEEGFATSEELLESSFVLGSRAEILAALQGRQPIETSFDVVDYLFSSGTGQGSGGSAAPGRARSLRPEPLGPSSSAAGDHAASPFHPPPFVESFTPALSTSPPMADAMPQMPHGAPAPSVASLVDELRALASVAAADGAVTQDDLDVLARAAAARGLPPLSLQEICVRRPFEVEAPASLVQRERLLEEMFHLAWSNEELDESEVRVIRDFARAWGVDPQRISEWTTIVTADGKSKAARWIDRVGYFLFPGW